jgi:hypothetical protein
MCQPQSSSCDPLPKSTMAGFIDETRSTPSGLRFLSHPDSRGLHPVLYYLTHSAWSLTRKHRTCGVLTAVGIAIGIGIPDHQATDLAIQAYCSAISIAIPIPMASHLKRPLRLAGSHDPRSRSASDQFDRDPEADSDSAPDGPWRCHPEGVEQIRPGWNPGDTDSPTMSSLKGLNWSFATRAGLPFVAARGARSIFSGATWVPGW